LNYILDACALIAYLNAEPGEDTIRDLLTRSKAGDGIALYMSIYNLLEVYYGFYREKNAETAKAIIQNVYRLPVTFIDRVTAPVLDEAARLKATYSCSLADAVGMALAVDLQGTFVTSDHHELEEVEQHERIPFLWLPPRPKK
jgi:predicted nucleic acid-binding protein